MGNGVRVDLLYIFDIIIKNTKKQRNKEYFFANLLKIGRENKCQWH